MTSLPVQSMQAGGALWFPDLTIPDPYCILPAISAATIYLVTKVHVIYYVIDVYAVYESDCGNVSIV